VVTKSLIVPPAKSTPNRASKRLKKTAIVGTSLEAHRPTTSSNDVSIVLVINFSLLELFSHTFALQSLMQKFLSLGAKCVEFQETARASQGMLVLCCIFYLFMCLPVVSYSISFSCCAL
jgi:hypothetical protein